MFRVDQIITATQLTRHYKEFVKLLMQEPQALLITHKSGEKLVIVNAEFYEDLAQRSFENSIADWGNSPLPGGSEVD